MAGWVDILYGTIGLVCGLCGTYGNALAFTFFIRRKRELSNYIYITMTVTDIIICLSLLPFTLSSWAGQPMLYSSPLFCNISGFVWNMVMKLSVFLVGLLSVTRCLSLVFPFRKIRVRYVMSCIVLYIVNLMIHAALPYIFNTRYTYNAQVLKCSWNISSIVAPGSAHYFIVYFLLVPFPFFFPAIPVLISSVLSVRAMMPSDMIQGDCRASIRKKRRASVTIILVTMVYTIFNIPYWLYLGTELYNMLHPIPDILAFDKDRHLLVFLDTLSVALNAACNAVVYFTRISALKSALYNYSLGPVSTGHT